jgi:hypothetical protein
MMKSCAVEEGKPAAKPKRQLARPLYRSVAERRDAGLLNSRVTMENTDALLRS